MLTVYILIMDIAMHLKYLYDHVIYLKTTYKK